MVTRNRYVSRPTALTAHSYQSSSYLAWPNLLLTLNSLFNQHPLRTKEGSNNPGSALMYVLPPSSSATTRLILVYLGSASLHSSHHTSLCSQFSNREHLLKFPHQCLSANPT